MKALIDRLTLCILVAVGHNIIDYGIEWYYAFAYWLIFWFWFDATYAHVGSFNKADKK